MPARPAPFSVRQLWWPLAAILIALIPVAGVFTTSRIFHVRDLTLYFWPHHLWLREVWAQGAWPWWDPHVATGISGIADSLNQVFLLPMTAIRLLCSPVVGFNLWVALPLPLAAAGTYLLLRVDASRAASLLGSAAFAVSGPVASTANFPNLSWTAALMPWVLWTARRLVEQPSAGRVAALGLAFGTQAVCGEPVILGTSAAGALAIAFVFGYGRTWTSAFRVCAALCLGALLAAAQLLPLWQAGQHSGRALSGVDNGWPMHPIQLAEAVMPHLFGHYYQTFKVDGWLLALNDQSSPFFYSLYIGTGLLLWALASRRHEARRVWWFWTSTLAVSLVAAFGDHTPLYPAAQAVLPPIRMLRFPIKYFLLTTLAVSALASLGWDTVRKQVHNGTPAVRGSIRIAWLIGGAAFVVALVPLAFPAPLAAMLNRLATSLAVPYADRSVAELSARVGPFALRVSALAIGWWMLAWVACHRKVRPALPLSALLALTIADPAAVNADLNPTMPASRLETPEWVRVMKSHGQGRVYVGGRWPPPVPLKDKTERRPALDGVLLDELPAEYSPIEARSLAGHEDLLSPSGFGVSEVISYDMPVLTPREYVIVLRRFVHHSFEERMRFLGRTGVRYCVLPRPPAPGMRSLAHLRILPMALYECHPDARRVYVAPRAQVVPDLAAQADALFEKDFDPLRTVLLPAAVPLPPGSRTVETASKPGARIVRERPDALTVEATAGPGGGYLVVLDAYDESWTVTVDGSPAPLSRAYAIFRAVPLAPGHHRVEFQYRPRILYAGMFLSGMGLMGILGLATPALLAALGVRRRRVTTPVAADTPASDTVSV